MPHNLYLHIFVRLSHLLADTTIKHLFPHVSDTNRIYPVDKCPWSSPTRRFYFHIRTSWRSRVERTVWLIAAISSKTSPLHLSQLHSSVTLSTVSAIPPHWLRCRRRVVRKWKQLILNSDYFSQSQLVKPRDDQDVADFAHNKACNEIWLSPVVLSPALWSCVSGSFPLSGRNCASTFDVKRANRAQRHLAALNSLFVESLSPRSYRRVIDSNRI